MKKWYAVCLLALLTFSLSAAGFSSNRFQLLARIYTEKAEKAFDAGDYDLAVEYTKLAEENAELSRAYIAKMLARAEADREIKAAMDLIARARAVKADQAQPDIFNAGLAAADEAKGLYGKESYEEAATRAKEAQDILRQLDLNIPPEVASSAGNPSVLPEYYVVRTWAGERDCLWNIAARPYVYGNPWEWKRLYDANISVFPNQDNPDLVVPGLVLKIPSLEGEKREGTYDPAQQYPSLSR